MGQVPDARDVERRRHAADIFADALEQPRDARSEFVRRACRDDDRLLDEVQTLLHARPEAGDWFDGAMGSGDEADAATQVSEPRDATGRVVSHYRLEEFLGAGGMGEVYRATDTALGRRAAVKLLRPGVSRDVRQRLVQEARAAAKLTHPAIATFFDSGVTDGVDFLAMEFVEGESLRARLRRGPLPPAQAIEITASLLEALVHAHAAGYLHRDIKPENVMLMESGGAKLLDFGLAKEIGVDELEATGGATMVTQVALTAHDVMLGTPGYMSPEQLRGQSVDQRTDVFGLGAVLYEMLTGEPAFGGGTSNERVNNTLSRDLPGVVVEGVPPDIDLILQRAVARDPTDRYPNASVFLSELRRAATGERLAVLPNTLAVADLENLREDPDDDWIGSGIAESLGVDLRRAEGLELVPRAKIGKARAALIEQNKAHDPIELGLAVGCRWVLTGSFQRMGKALRLTMRLVEVATGKDLWVEKLDGEVDDLFRMQDRLAEVTVESLELVLPEATDEGSVPTLDAFECYARAQQLLHRWERGLAEQGRELLERALELDPDYAPALATMAAIYAPSRWIGSADPRDLARAMEYADRAVGADPQLAEAHLWRGYAQWRGDDVEGAMESFRRATALDSSSAAPYFTGCCRFQLGQLEDALEELRRALAVEPNAPHVAMLLGFTLLELGDEEAALWTLERAYVLERDPASSGWVSAGSAWAEALRRVGRLGEARDRVMDALGFLEQSDVFTRGPARPQTLVALGRIALDQQDQEAARVAFEQAISIIKAQRAGVGMGHPLVQALTGLSRAIGDPALYAEAAELFDSRRDYNFSFGLMAEPYSLFDLARAARALGRQDEARSFAERANRAGTRQTLD